MAVRWSLGPQQTEVEERIRTASLCITALGVVFGLLYFLRPALVPLVLALALKHLLQPIISVLSVRPLVCCGRTLLARPLACEAHKRGGLKSKRLHSMLDAVCRLQLPHGAAVIVSLLIAFMVLGMLAAIVAGSVRVFGDRADVYAHRVELLLGQVFGWIESFSCGWTPAGCHVSNSTNTSSPTDHGNSTLPPSDAGAELQRLLSKVPINKLVLAAVESMLDLLSNLFIVFLFTVYLLAKGSTQPDEADKQILEYIKGKVALSLIVGVCTALVLFLIGLDLWLCFATLAFWLNFVPNVGAVVAVFLPMPLIILGPDLSTFAMVMAFLLPFSCHMIVGNVFEPLLFGRRAQPPRNHRATTAQPPRNQPPSKS